MKQYTGTKTVKAEPMNIEEAISKGLHHPRPNILPPLNGYHVVYPDGYESWSPKSVFEEAYKPSETFIDRITNELNELTEKKEKLDSFLKVSHIGENEKALLKIQSGIMKSYEEILKHRLYISVKNGKFKKVSNEPEYHRDISTDK